MIREHIAKIVGNRDSPREIDYETADIVVAYLDSVNVVIKREPDEYCSFYEDGCGEDFFNECPVLKAGYVATEPLIKEG